MGSGKSAAATEGQAPPRAIGLMEELSQDPEEFRGDPRRAGAAPGEPAVTGVLAFFTTYCESNIEHRGGNPLTWSTGRER